MAKQNTCKGRPAGDCGGSANTNADVRKSSLQVGSYWFGCWKHEAFVMELKALRPNVAYSAGFSTFA